MHLCNTSRVLLCVVEFHLNHNRCPAQHKDGAETESLTEIKESSCAGRSCADTARFEGLLRAEATHAENVCTHGALTSFGRLQQNDTWHQSCLGVLFYSLSTPKLCI